MTEEKCEYCKKEITKEMKESQQVIYAQACHTLDENMEDEMFDGVFCSRECYEEIAGIKMAYEKGKKDEIKMMWKMLRSVFPEEK